MIIDRVRREIQVGCGLTVGQALGDLFGNSDFGVSEAGPSVGWRGCRVAPRGAPRVRAAGFPSNRGDFLIADSCNFAASSDYRTPVHLRSLASSARLRPATAGPARRAPGRGRLLA